MADLADDWREHDVGRRFDPGEGGDEIAHLGRTLDQMLDRIVDSLSAERRLTDEIAHELRTPLAVVLAEADLARQHATDRRNARASTTSTPPRCGCATRSTPCCRWRGRTPRGGERATVGELMAALDLPPHGVRRGRAGRAGRTPGRGRAPAAGERRTARPG